MLRFFLCSWPYAQPSLGCFCPLIIPLSSYSFGYHRRLVFISPAISCLKFIGAIEARGHRKNETARFSVLSVSSRSVSKWSRLLRSRRRTPGTSLQPSDPLLCRDVQAFRRTGR